MAEWTQEEDEILTKLWIEGYSSSQIALKVGGNRTRNSVIGRAHRLKLGGHRTATRIKSTPRGPRISFPTRAISSEALIDMREATKLVFQITKEEHSEPKVETKKKKSTKKKKYSTKCLMQLNRHTCHFPMWKHGVSGDTYCGKPVYGDSSYCKHHHDITHVASLPRRPRPPKPGNIKIIGSSIDKEMDSHDEES